METTRTSKCCTRRRFSMMARGTCVTTSRTCRVATAGTWKGLSFLALGGAASIDRKHRRDRYSWWVEEYLTEEDILTAQSSGPVDIMITHDSPYGAPNSITDDPQGQLGA